ncbi:MAG: hypothetical protein LBR36_00275 [Bacteroidales bacterium]|jgi:hypothetical protein|nr:hypothetical protein [Bacteroidales bacterium]
MNDTTTTYTDSTFVAKTEHSLSKDNLSENPFSIVSVFLIVIVFLLLFAGLTKLLTWFLKKRKE